MAKEHRMRIEGAELKLKDSSPKEVHEDIQFLEETIRCIEIASILLFVSPDRGTLLSGLKRIYIDLGGDPKDVV